jgi:hypothetical protein
MTRYKIIRHHWNEEHPDHLRTIKTGLTLEQAREHCRRDDTHSKNPDGTVQWFDGYTEQRPDEPDPETYEIAAEQRRDADRSASRYEARAWKAAQDGNHAAAARHWQTAAQIWKQAEGAARRMADRPAIMDARDHIRYASDQRAAQATKAGRMNQ